MTHGKTTRTALASKELLTKSGVSKGGARKHDPSTSKEAAKSVDAQGLVEACYALLKEAGSRGLTAYEMSELLGVDRDSISPRLPTLRKEYGVKDSEVTRSRPGGRRQKVWITPKVSSAPLPPKARGSGTVKLGGEVVGTVKNATITVLERDIKHDLWIKDSDGVAEAMQTGRGVWVFDLALMEALADKGVRFIEVPTTVGRHESNRYRTTLDLLLGPLGFIIEGKDERPKVCLELKHWVRI